MNTRRLCSWILALAIAFSVWAPPRPALAAALTVTSTGDDIDGSCLSITPASLPGADGEVTLREALCAANNNPGADTINFDLFGPGVHTIFPTSTLPPLRDDITLDGYSQPGAVPATAESGIATLKVVIDGAHAGLANGLEIYGAGNAVRGLAIVHFQRNGVYISGVEATGNTLSGNHIGLNAAGTLCQPNSMNGVFVRDGASGNTVGGDAPGERNVISCNTWSGVGITGPTTSNNTVAGNYLGPDAGGVIDLGNTEAGVWIFSGAHGNQVGGFTAGERNVIAGNDEFGVLLEGVATNENTLAGNYIGVDRTGYQALENNGSGIVIRTGSSNNTVGGTTGVTPGGECTGACNLISSNALQGIEILDGETQGNVIAGNYIGTDHFGMAGLGNVHSGISLREGTHDNLIGGSTPAARNVISGNHSAGVRLVETSHNITRGNYIGTDRSGSQRVANAECGIAITDGSDSNQIGGGAPGEGNLISGNGDCGILLAGAAPLEPTNRNVIAGNLIGVDASGKLPLGNFFHGIIIGNNTQYNHIGGTTPAEGNRIGCSGNYGVFLEGENNSGNFLRNNTVGTDASGRLDLGNGGEGVMITSGAAGALIQGGKIAFNGQAGVHVAGATSDQNDIYWVDIYSNGASGIQLSAGANAGVAAPVITAIEAHADGSAIISGQACANCRVDLFANSTPDGEGEFSRYSITADAAGNFSHTLEPFPYPYWTATATNAAHNTSQFSGVFVSPVRTLYLPVTRRD